jgi:hypothetical protein
MILRFVMLSPDIEPVTMPTLVFVFEPNHFSSSSVVGRRVSNSFHEIAGSFDLGLTGMTAKPLSE